MHFEPRGVHLLIIPRQRKKPEQLRSDLDFRAILENKCDLSILVNDGLFDHHRPDGVVPVMHHSRLFLEGADIKCPSTSAVTACRVSSGICLEAQAALPIELKVPQTQTGPVFVTLRR